MNLDGQNRRIGGASGYRRTRSLPLPARSRLAVSCTIALLACASARAYETDQLTERGQPLEDALPVANARVDVMLASAIDRVNARTRCQATPEETRRLLADEIHELSAVKRMVWRRGLTRMAGFGRYAAWMETAPVSSRPFLDREDIFGELSFMESVILHTSGPCGTLRVGGVLVGTDKFDHFWDLGFNYWKLAERKDDATAGVAYGTNTELFYYGLLTSRTFSFADLRANYDGYLFYADLLEGDSLLQLDEDGCVVQTRAWDWRDWLDWEYDEVLNPSVFAPIVQWGLTRTLIERKEEVCADYAQWGGPAYAAHLDAVLSSPVPPYVYGPSPARSDPFQLEALCNGASLWSGN